MQPHQERVVTELNELNGKIEKLIPFIGSKIYESLPEAEQLRLNKQLGYMQLYSNVLQERITAF